MNNLLRVASAAAIAVAMAALTGAPLAHAEPIEAGNTGSLTIHKHVQDEQYSTPGSPAGKPLAGIEFSAQQVLHDPDGAGPLPAGPIDMTTAEGWALAEQVFASPAPTLPANFSLAAAAVQSTDASGIATFSGLDLGAYLVTETGFGDNDVVAPAAPFWVSVPMPDADGGWIYDVVAYPKNEIATPTPTPTPEPTPTPTPTPAPSPDHGSINTGIPGVGDINTAMLLGGAGLVAGAVALLVLSRRGKHAAPEVDTEGA